MRFASLCSLVAALVAAPIGCGGGGGSTTEMSPETKKAVFKSKVGVDSDQIDFNSKTKARRGAVAKRP